VSVAADATRRSPSSRIDGSSRMLRVNMFNLERAEHLKSQPMPAARRPAGLGVAMTTRQRTCQSSP